MNVSRRLRSVFCMRTPIREHERLAARIVHDAMPGVAVSVSHQVSPELREYDRTSTTVANAYVQPLARRYHWRDCPKDWSAKGIVAPLHIMLSNGGVCSAETAAAFPVRSRGIRSQRRGVVRRLLGGTVRTGGTCSRSIWAEPRQRPCSAGEGGFPVTNESEVARVYRFKRGSGLPLLVPVLDMIEIGAGGGSIAHLNRMGLPAVGPESAGSVPGPACYANGGGEPTVTDADLLLGKLDPGYFLGGKIGLDVDRARNAVQRLSARLGMDVNRMAWGIHRMVNENMANAARGPRGQSVEPISGGSRWWPPGARDRVHACGVAERLGIATVIVPPAAGVSSAFGLMLAPSFVRLRKELRRAARGAGLQEAERPV